MASRLGYGSPYGHGYTGGRTDIAPGTTNGGRSGMNTLTGTDEGRAEPSVWPVYLAAAVVAVVSLSHLLEALPELIGGPFVDFSFLLRDVSFIICYLFGVLTAWGLVRLRPWAWWYAIMWTIAFVLTPNMQVIFIPGMEPLWPAAAYAIDALSAEEKIGWLVLAAIPIVLVVWPLVTRRRLFSTGAQPYVVAVGGLCIAFFLIVANPAFSWVWILAYRLQPIRDGNLTHVSDYLLDAPLDLPASTTLVEGFMYPGMDSTSYYKLQISHSEIHEFMQQESLQENWRTGNAVASHLPGTLKRRWRKMFRAKDCRSWVGKGYQSSDVVITVCLDSTADATVYIRDFDM